MVAGCASFPLSLGQLPLYFFKEKEMQSWTLTFTTEELNIIMAGLGELPAKTSINVIQKIHGVVQTTTPKDLDQMEIPLGNTDNEPSES